MSEEDCINYKKKTILNKLFNIKVLSCKTKRAVATRTSSSKLICEPRQLKTD
jgi:hypothetical protein